MRLSRYDPEYDRKHIDSMLMERDMPRSAADDLPKTGFIFMVDNRPIAAGFYRHCEGHTAMLDSYISSPSETPELRNKALDLITKILLRTAERKGIKTMLAFSTDHNTITRSLAHGFEAIPHIMSIKKVG